jgi:hypothetical protein
MWHLIYKSKEKVIIDLFESMTAVKVVTNDVYEQFATEDEVQARMYALELAVPAIPDTPPPIPVDPNLDIRAAVKELQIKMNNFDSVFNIGEEKIYVIAADGKDNFSAPQIKLNFAIVEKADGNNGVMLNPPKVGQVTYLYNDSEQQLRIYPYFKTFINFFGPDEPFMLEGYEVAVVLAKEEKRYLASKMLIAK